MTSVADRAAPVFAEMSYAMVAFPVPEAGLVSVIHEGTPVTVQEQVDGAVTFTLLMPPNVLPVAVKLRLAAESVGAG